MHGHRSQVLMTSTGNWALVRRILLEQVCQIDSRFQILIVSYETKFDYNETDLQIICVFIAFAEVQGC